MSYQVLARKWRPKDFSQLIGQEHVVTVLVNALMQERLHHAYLFTGTRGVGKTTIARIFAKSLNCLQGITATPCGKCDVCVDVDQGNFVDLLEIDAASRTKVDDTREILDNVQYAPTRGRFKVYLIDEVHMLSKSSFNALLKTLEEPPPHVKFILATTDPQKLPVTVLSRCLQFHLKALTPKQIEQKLTEILTAENVTFENSALTVLAKAARGSMRDSLSLTDQAIAQGQGHITSANLQSMLGGVDQNWIYKILIALIKQDKQSLLELSQSIASFAPSYHRLLAELLQLLHQVALWQLVPNSVDVDEQRATLLTKFARAMSPEDVQLYYQIVLNGRKDLPYSFDEQAGFDMVILRLLAFKPKEESDVVNTAKESQTDVQTANDTTFEDVAQSLITEKAKPVKTFIKQDAPSKSKVEIQETLPKEPVENSLKNIEDGSASTTQLADKPTQNIIQRPIPSTDSATLNAEQQQLEQFAQQQFAPIDSYQQDDFIPDDSSDTHEIDHSYTPEPIVASTSQPPTYPDSVQAPTQSPFEPESQVAIESAEDNSRGTQVQNNRIVNKSTEGDRKEGDGKEGDGKEGDRKEGDSALEKLLATRNMLRSRKKQSEGSGKKPSGQAEHAAGLTDKASNTIIENTKVNTPNKSTQNINVPSENLAQTHVELQSFEQGLSETKPSILKKQQNFQHERQTIESQPVSHEDETYEVQTILAQETNTLEKQITSPVIMNTLANFNADLIDPNTIQYANQVDHWAQLIDVMDLGGRVRQLAFNATIDPQSNDSFLKINLNKNSAHINSPAALEQIKARFSAIKNQPVNVEIELVEDPGMTPLVIQQIINDKRLANAQNIIHHDKFVLHLGQKFDASIIEESIEPL